MKELKPFNLGVLDGLSDQEARDRFPDYARMIEDWRLGVIDISQVQIPGATDMVEFFEAGKKVLERLTLGSGSIVVVGTRSVLVMMWNILRGNTPHDGGGYFERPWDNCEWVEFARTNEDQWREGRQQRDKE